MKSYDVLTLKSIIKKACEDLLKQGITSIHTDDFNMSVDYKRIIQAYSELAEEGNLPVRVTQQCLVVNQEELEGFINCNYKGLNIDNFYRIGPVKILADGSLGARSAALRKPYADAPNMKGILIHNENELKKVVETCHKSGYYVAIHCIGDKALELAIDSIDYARKKYPNISLRHGIVHCQITDENLLNRIKEMDLLIYAQPIFLNYDLHIVENRVGKDLASSSYNFGRLVHNGVHMSMGTDSPVEKFNPMENIYCAVTRKDLNGYPKEGFYPEESITVEESIKAYTCESAYCSYEENVKGKIKDGYFADMTVLSDDIYNISNEKLLDVKVEITIVDGIIRYESKQRCN
jgi:predicted amidohydrolase YtcJ